MEEIPKSCRLLEHYPDTLATARKELNLTPRMINDSLDILEDWLKKQTHFVKNDFNRGYLERSLIISKGSVERTKATLDKLCTFKTLMPEFFNVRDVKTELASLRQYVNSAFMRKLTYDHTRVYVLRFNADTFDSADVFKYFKLLMITGEFSRKHEYCCGFRLVWDLRSMNVLNVVSKINPMDLRKVMTLLIEGYGMRVKSINILSESKLIDSFIALFKQVLSAKIASRMHVNKTLDSLHEVIKPTEVLPEEYGGKDMPLEKLNDEWFNTLSSDEHTEYMMEMNKAITNESCRQNKEFNDHYIGMPGSFRALSVD